MAFSSWGKEAHGRQDEAKGEEVEQDFLSAAKDTENADPLNVQWARKQKAAENGVEALKVEGSAVRGPHAWPVSATCWDCFPIYRNKIGRLVSQDSGELNQL